jgi:hypothetical protein
MFDLDKFEKELQSALDQKDEIRSENLIKVIQVTKLGNVFLSQIRQNLFNSAYIFYTSKGFKIDLKYHPILEVEIDNLYERKDLWNIKYDRLNTSETTQVYDQVSLDSIPACLKAIALEWKCNS